MECHMEINHSVSCSCITTLVSDFYTKKIIKAAIAIPKFHAWIFDWSHLATNEHYSFAHLKRSD